jgi:hypothetical protein
MVYECMVSGKAVGAAGIVILGLTAACQSHHVDEQSWWRDVWPHGYANTGYDDGEIVEITGAGARGQVALCYLRCVGCEWVSIENIKPRVILVILSALMAGDGCKTSLTIDLVMGQCTSPLSPDPIPLRQQNTLSVRFEDGTWNLVGTGALITVTGLATILGNAGVFKR